LESLQERVNEVVRVEGWNAAVGSGNAKWIVTVDLGVLSEDRLAALEPFAGEPICVAGQDPADAVADGPQSEGGDGWRLLGEDLTGQAYRTGIATDAEQYAELWVTAGLGGTPPEVDFNSEVVIWFGAVFGSSCPIRLDGVVVDADRALLYADLVVPGNPAACTGDANPHSFVVAVERAALPAGPFAVQLRSEDPPSGVPEERTLVDADLTSPASVATDEQIGPDPDLMAAAAQPAAITSGGVVEPGYTVGYLLPVDCGAQVLGVVNGVRWTTTEAAAGELPDEWRAAAGADDVVRVTILLHEEGPQLEATAGGRTLTYSPGTDGEVCS
jgi:hypothetical protein